ncbi:VOC family protein [Nocardia goodfellowii]|uniref:Enzyme related to lactoylglutathione lyase n=1 Tax=Nocardia goodfellowii TaxID=882446 RepID=A0ABS4QEP3_9NOCA|nr:hypothetical protein [Nocardia goodfellowii]MBP2190176.1 putative enzyme related to lactoylglutathione lyase [Nocardia goodfellowii]
MDCKSVDVDVAARVFADEFGWECRVDPNDWRGAIKARADRHWVAGVSNLGSPLYPRGTPPHISYYLGVEDAAAVHHLATSHGASSLLAPTPIADQGTLATIVDPFGAVVSLWQPQTFTGWSHPLGPRTPSQVVHESRDPAAAERFYRRQLGLRLKDADFTPPLPGDPLDGDAAWTVAIEVAGESMRAVHLDTGHRYLRH